MRLIITLILIIGAIDGYSQSCPPNIDFEAGNLAGWDCFLGSTSVVTGVNVITLNPSPPTPGRHELISAASSPTMDPYGNFPALCPYAGNYSVKLGNENTGSEAEGMSYTFQIPALDDTFSLTYFYAVVFEDPGHDTYEQPRFFVTAYDVLTGNIIDCASYNYISTASIPGFQRSVVDTSVLYKDWSPASIDFSGLGGRTVRLEFKTADCTLTGHFGYAYLDVGNGCGGLISVAALCGSTNSVVLNAPYGFQTYTWYNANYGTIVGNQQNSTISPAPPPNTMFHVDMIPYPGFGCRDTADAMVTALPVPDTPAAVRNYYYCQFATPSALIATADHPNILLWYTSATGGIGSEVTPIPPTDVAGVFTYFVSQKKLFGCESERVQITVNISPTPQASFNINDDSQCQNNNNFVFTSTSTNTNTNTVYTWDFGDGNTSSLPNASHTYANYGLYTVKLKVENPPTCFTEITEQVNVVAIPSAQITYPQNICENQTPIILASNSSVPGNSGTVNQWQWTIGTTTTSVQNPPPFFANGGQLPVSLIVGTSEGCFSAESHVSINVHYRPDAKFKSDALCSNETVHLTDISALPAAAAPDQINAWSWLIDNSTTFNIKNPALLLTAGVHNIKLVSETNVGCKSPALDSTVTVHDKPHIQVTLSDSCVNRTITYSAGIINGDPVTTWYWNFGNGFYGGPREVFKMFDREGYNPVSLIGKTIQGCKDTLNRPFTIYQNHAFAGNDTTVAMDQPVQLNAGGGSTVNYSWSPSTGLNDSQIENPIALLNTDQLYELHSISVYGCESNSNILIKRYKGPELFIPTAFTPNGDGLNDILNVFAIGMKTFYSFDVYNRFGVCLFHTTDQFKGWNGTYKGMKTDPGNYVVVAKAQDYRGKFIVKKVNVILLR